MHVSRQAQDQDALPHWLVVVWPAKDCRYLPVAACVTRDEAVAEAARHAGAVILYRPVPVPTPNPK